MAYVYKKIIIWKADRRMGQKQDDEEEIAVGQLIAVKGGLSEGPETTAQIGLIVPDACPYSIQHKHTVEASSVYHSAHLQTTLLWSQCLSCPSLIETAATFDCQTRRLHVCSCSWSNILCADADPRCYCHPKSEKKNGFSVLSNEGWFERHHFPLDHQQRFRSSNMNYAASSCTGACAVLSLNTLTIITKREKTRTNKQSNVSVKQS